MANSILIQPSSFSSSYVSDSFFYKSPTDVKYTNSRYNSFSPVSSMKNTKKITFNLPPYSGNSLYDLSNSYIEMKLRIVDSDGNLPNPSEYVVGLINNSLQSLFSDVKLILNG